MGAVLAHIRWGLGARLRLWRPRFRWVLDERSIGIFRGLTDEVKTKWPKLRRHVPDTMEEIRPRDSCNYASVRHQKVFHPQRGLELSESIRSEGFKVRTRPCSSMNANGHTLTCDCSTNPWTFHWITAPLPRDPPGPKALIKRANTLATYGGILTAAQGLWRGPWGGTFLTLDFEWRQNDPHRVTECGFVEFVLSDGHRQVEEGHMIVEEEQLSGAAPQVRCTLHFHLNRASSVLQGTYTFGDIVVLPRDEWASKLSDRIRRALRRGPVVIVLHDHVNDLKYATAALS